MKKLFGFLVIGIAGSSLVLTGCGLDQTPPYSANVKYGVRTDPLIVGSAADLGEERYDPDRPGVLPIMKFEQIFDPEFPYNAKFRKKLEPILDALIDAEKKDVKLSPSERMALENKLLRDPKNRAKFDPMLDTTIRDPLNISAEDRKDLEKALEGQFGTPAKPTLNAKDADIDEDTVKLLKLDDDTLQEGSRNYRIHCMHCHGVPGDGRGPTSRWVNPHPRDFRRGLFKFQSVDQTGGTLSPPARGDLLRTVRHGLEGTAMPSFGILHDKELEALVSYVMYLSIRGSTEYKVMSFNFKLSAGKDSGAALVWEGNNPADDEPMDKAQWVKFFLKNKIIFGSGGWKEANDPAKAIKPVPYPYQAGDMKQLAASVQRGQQLFIGSKDHPRGKDANCKQCHDDFGRQARFKFDEWGTFTRPNNFPQGIFRGGRRPVDLYYRVHSGINGSGMINFGKVLEGQDIWDLVNFVSSLSYPAMYENVGIKIN